MKWYHASFTRKSRGFDSLTDDLKKIFITLLALLNAAEGVIHLVTAGVSFYGIYDLGIRDWRVMAAPTADSVLGIVSLVTGYVLNKIGQNGHHH